MLVRLPLPLVCEVRWWERAGQQNVPTRTGVAGVLTLPLTGDNVRPAKRAVISQLPCAAAASKRPDLEFVSPRRLITPTQSLVPGMCSIIIIKTGFTVTCAKVT